MNGSRKKGELSIDDRILWSRIARSTDPLPGKNWPTTPEEAIAKPPTRNGAKALVEPVTHPPYRPPTSKESAKTSAPSIDLPTRRKLAKGRLSIDATIDLHDLDQAEAHGMLLAFLHRAHAAGLRHVLVITGKGSSLGSAGVLKRSVPEWLSTVPFRGLVSGYENAARHHGGEGAIYIRLSRRGERR